MRHANLTQKQKEQRNKRIRAYQEHRKKLRKRRAEEGYEFLKNVRETRSGGG